MGERTQAPKLSGQFSKALVYAELKHHNQVRKGGDVPHVGHLLSVASLVINDGGSEAQAIAAYRRRGPDSWMLDELRRVIDELSDAVVV